MLTIYHMPPSRSVRIVWLAEEMGLLYRTVGVSVMNPTPEFLAVSPLGQSPAIQDGDVKMIESIAIMQYLMARHGPTELAVQPEEKDYPAYIQFLEFGEAGLCSIGNAAVATRYMAPEDQKKNWTANYIAEAQRKRLGVVRRHLQDRQYMAADRFTAADISIGFALSVFKLFGVMKDADPVLDAYFERLTARPAFQRASAQPAAAA
ncbi:MAG TPA: glutathione S-transferase family protein [Caulobacterales bacterium]|jgi:glutathione S-transferase/3-isopropylmalate dehydratase|nr:glutathione S-transferase family protein [Caulobacterales bacterium]